MQGTDRLNAPLIWAHRGARSVAPENTMAAARAAKAQGAHGWEVDVHLSRDNEVVLVHDFGLRRTTDIAEKKGQSRRREQVVNALTLEQLRALDVGSWFIRRDPFKTIAAGLITAEELASFRAERMPTLAEALAWSRDAGLQVNVEIKDMLGGDDDGLVRATAHVIRASGMAERVCVSSFRAASVKFFRMLCPDVTAGLLLGAKEMRAATPQIIEMLHRLDARALHPSGHGLAPGRVKEFTQAGFAVNVYTVNAVEDLFRFAREGATGIITDYPGRAKEVYATRG